MNPRTIFDVFSDFEVSDAKTNKAVVRGVMHRFLASHWGGEPPKGAKSTNEEVFSFREIMKKTPAILLAGSNELLEQEFTKKGIDKENSKSYRSAYKSFFNWAESNGCFLSTKEIKKDIELQINLNMFSKFGCGASKGRTNYHGKIYKEAYALNAKHNNNKGKIGQLIYPSDYINNNLATEIKLFEKFRSEKNNCVKSTIRGNTKIIYQMLGWLHRYKNISLEDLSLQSIITYIELNISYGDCKDKKGKINANDYVYKKAMLREKAIESAIKNKKLIEEYINDFLGGHPTSKTLVVTTCIAVAKFLFKDEIGTDDYIDYKDLPIIKRLNQLSNQFSKEANSTPSSVPHSNKSVSWAEALNVLEVLRRRIHWEKTEHVITQKTKNGMKEYVKSKLRDKNSIINNLQRFLSLAFMTLIPTDRARTYYELEIGSTFVYGLYKNGRFTSLDKLKDKSEAIWYIHLMPGDYKTGKIYKEYWGIMPNVEFPDGNKLYDYINSWITEGRDYRQKCDHNFFFRQESYRSMSCSNWSGRIKNIFIYQTGVPVTPKEIRKMYITHLNNSGATNAELKGAAYAQHHSQKMQESVYNSQTTLDRIGPIYELNERLWNEAIKPPSKQESIAA